nr:energy transducer TonB [Desulfobacula sp.]
MPEGIISGVAGGISPAGTGFGSANDYYQMVQVKIESRKQYPATARQQNQEGRVTVYFTMPDGGISDLKIVKGSRFKALDQAALEAVKSLRALSQAAPGSFSRLPEITAHPGF